MKKVKYLILFILGLSIIGIFLTPSLKTNIGTKFSENVENNAVINNFIENGVFPQTDKFNLPSNLKTYGSWTGSDTGQGKFVSDWYKSRGNIRLYVAGYPNKENKLLLEASKKDGSIYEILYPNEDPKENWRLWEVNLKQDDLKFRIIAIDSSSKTGGWLGFSEPLQDRFYILKNLVYIFKISATVCLSITLLIGPGIIFYSYISINSIYRSLLFMIIPGPIILTCIGLILWITPPSLISNKLLCYLLLLPLLIFITLSLLKLKWNQLFTNKELKVFAIFIVLIIIAVAKVSFSQGPLGELYGNTISRTFEVGDRSDSRISYHTVQLVNNHLIPYEPEGQKYFSPYYFSSRGPLGGLIASSVAIVTSNNIPLGMPDQTWEPFDDNGFTSYRIVMIILASLSIFAIYGLLEKITNSMWAMYGVSLIVLTPFYVHELYFTWPKFASASYILVALYTLIHKKYYQTGLYICLSYLFHPIAVTILPFFLIWIPFVSIKISMIFVKEHVRNIFQLLLGFSSLFTLWYLLNMHHFAQGSFISYFLMADMRGNSSIFQWFVSRFNLLTNTMIPLNLFLVHSDHPSINSIYGKSPAIIRYYFQYWTTIPFGVGIIMFFRLVPLVIKYFNNFKFIWMIYIIFPFILLIIYWGAASTGIMRECGHIIYFGLFIVLIYCSYRLNDSQIVNLINSKIMNVLRGCEIFSMLFFPTFFTSTALYDRKLILVDITSLSIVVIGLVILVKLIKTDEEKFTKVI